MYQYWCGHTSDSSDDYGTVATCLSYTFSDAFAHILFFVLYLQFLYLRANLINVHILGCPKIFFRFIRK